ncbi:protein DML1 [Venturia nashicola]|uniref:Protein DML1 n=1 Tax=Venturia nashicola TaxID=86259 RepID=A0A4Z1PA93_9PEZI|nr:protein DML1 [Venturia nashicola]
MQLAGLHAMKPPCIWNFRICVRKRVFSLVRIMTRSISAYALHTQNLEEAELGVQLPLDCRRESYFTYSGDEESQLDHDIHFRPGVAADGTDTFTPRTVIYDLKDNFGTLRQRNALYEIQQDSAAQSGIWNAAPITLAPIAPIPQHEYQLSLDSGVAPPPLSSSSVRFWSDYNRVFYHPRSLVQLNVPTAHLAAPNPNQLSPFDRWDVGEDLFATEDLEHELLDRDLRPFVEECDQMQGFQVIAGADDAWAGFASKYLEALIDEFGRKSVWVWGLEEARQAGREKRLQQLINTSRSFQTLASQASLYIPLSNIPSGISPSYLNLSTDSAWNTSALQAAAYESITLPSRLRSTNGPRGTMSDFELQFTNEVNRNILEVEMTAKDPNTYTEPTTNGITDHRMTNGISEEDEAPKEPEALDIRFSKNERGGNRRKHIFSRINVCRGTWPAHSESSPQTIIQTFETQLLFNLPSSFPEIFKYPRHLPGEFGTERDLPVYTMQAPTNGLATHTALSSSTSVVHRIRGLAEIVGRVVGVEEREGLRSDLLRVGEEYVDGWDSGSDEDDD